MCQVPSDLEHLSMGPLPPIRHGDPVLSFAEATVTDGALARMPRGLDSIIGQYLLVEVW